MQLAGKLLTLKIEIK